MYTILSQTYYHNTLESRKDIAQAKWHMCVHKEPSPSFHCFNILGILGSSRSRERLPGSGSTDCPYLPCPTLSARSCIWLGLLRHASQLCRKHLSTSRRRPAHNRRSLGLINGHPSMVWCRHRTLSPLEIAYWWQQLPLTSFFLSSLIPFYYFFYLYLYNLIKQHIL